MAYPYPVYDPSAVAPIFENKKYAGNLLMQKWYVEDYLTHKCVKNNGEKPQYFVEDDHECCPYVNTFAPLRKPVNWAFLAIPALHTPGQSA